jgi:CRISPR system Cascade subunit CasA
MTFNLVDDRWLPVRYTDGRARELGLRELFRDAPAIATVAIGYPPEWVATMRMLVTVLQSAVAGPTSIADRVRWLEHHEALAAQVDAYLTTWHARFELFDEDRPFMQAPLDNAVAPTTVAAIRADWASGNNVILFDHHVDDRPEALTPGQAVRALLATLLFAPGGGVAKPFNRTDSPATKGLQVLVERGDLWASLVLNARQIGRREQDEDTARPYWERDAHDGARPDKAGTFPDGWLDRATFRSRAIRLLVDDDGLVRRIRLQQHLKLHEDELARDPYTPVRRSPGKPTTIMRANPTKALWRDAEALYLGLRVGEDATGTPIVIDAVHALEEIKVGGVTAVRVVGQVVNQAKIVDVRDARLPLSAGLLESDAHVALVAELNDLAERAAGALRAGVMSATKHLASTESGRHERWLTSYWAAMAPRFMAVVEGVAASGSGSPPLDIVDPWRRTVQALARDLYDQFADDAGRGRAHEAMGRGRVALESKLMQMNPKRLEEGKA